MSADFPLGQVYGLHAGSMIDSSKEKHETELANFSLLTAMYTTDNRSHISQE